MTDFTDDYQSQDEQACIARFHEMLRKKSANYFDVHEVEMIAEHFLELNNHSLAKKAIDIGMQLHHQSHTLKLCAAKVYAVNGNLSKAMRLLEEIEMVENKNEEIFLIKASIHSQLKNHEKSIENLQKAAELTSHQQDEILLDLAFEQENQQDFAGAVETLKKALTLNPNNDAALHEIGFCYDALCNPNEVIKFYTSFLDHHPYSYAAWYNLGNAYYKEEDFENCIKAYDYSLVIENTFTPALLNKANALIQLERYAEAIVDFEESLLIEGPQSETHCYLGECFEKLGQIENSRMHYLLAIELNKNCADAHIGLAVLLELENKWRDSLSSYKTALEIDPNHSGYWNMYALACHKCNEIFDAEAAFLKSLSIDKTNAEAWEEYSVFKAEIAGYDKAVSILTEGLTHNTNDSLLQYRLTYYLCQTHKFVEANDLLSLAIKSDPNGLVDFLEYYPEALLNPNLLSLKGHKIIR